MALILSGDSPSLSGTYQGGAITSGTSQASTSGTAISFTSIPSWVKKITVMLNGVSTNGSSPLQVQIGSGSYTTSGYNGAVSYAASAVSTETRTTGLPIMNSAGQFADAAVYGLFVAALQTGNTWVSSCTVAKTGATNLTCFGGGSLALGGTLDRIQVTTLNGTDTFDAGSINILYE
jgi:hypothetical protein